CFFFSSRRRHTSSKRDWSSDVCSSDLCGYVNASFLTVSKTSRVGVDSRFTAAVGSSSLLDKASAAPFIFPGLYSTSMSYPNSLRSEERRVGKEWRARSGPEHEQEEHQI